MIKSHTFRGVRYKVNVEQRIQGWADVPGREPKSIYVDPEMGPKDFLETAIHEGMHAEDPEEKEQVIHRRAAAIARWLWRLGYRKDG